ncbi:hypothetical protein BFJ67_g18350 [Fusarium oxysporum f. sp. cepae]|nr:hypothetical protein BFJ67_g18350 [Fusarium oxysporum f. sp. cepae]
MPTQSVTNVSQLLRLCDVRPPIEGEHPRRADLVDGRAGFVAIGVTRLRRHLVAGF